MAGGPAPEAPRLRGRLLREMVARYQVPGRARCRYVWHGGEPTLAGIAYYREVLGLQAEYRQPGQSVTNFIQTNAWLVDERWAEFLAAEGFRVGVSLDGPEEANDRQRGVGYHRRTMRALEELRRRGVDFTCICVVTSRNVERSDETFRFFREAGFRRLAFNPVFGEHPGYDVDPEAFGRFLCRIFDLWLEADDPTMEVRFLRETVIGLLGGKVDLCSMQGGMQGHLVVDGNGDLLPCFGAAGDETPIGNVATTTFEEAQERLAALALPLAAYVALACAGCRWRELCGGDCVRFLREADGMPRRTPFCSARQTIFGHVERALKARGMLAAGPGNA